MAKKSTVVDMTQGSAVRHILIFSLPMLIGNLFQQVYNLVDSMIVGKLVGAEALAAIGTTSSITFMFFALCNGIGTGGGIITSQFFGSGDERKVRRCIANTGYIMVVFPAIVGTVAFFSCVPILSLLNTPEAIMVDASAYIRTMCVGILFVSIYNYAASMLRALGDSRTPLYFLIFASVLNVGLDLLFVAVFHMGVMGAGVATVIAQFVSGIACLWYAFKANPYFTFKREDLQPDRGLILKTLRLGVPLSLQFSLIAISNMALQRVVNSFGAVTVAAFTATSRIEMLMHQPYQTLGTALSTFCGQNYGAKRDDRVVGGYHRGLAIMFVFTLIMFPVMQLFGRSIVHWFVNEEEVIAMGAQALKISSLFYLFLGVIYVVRGTLNGVGDAFFALLNGVVEIFGRFIVPITMTSIAGIGLWGIWWSVGIVWGLSGFTAWLRYLTFYRKVKNGTAHPEQA